MTDDPYGDERWAVYGIPAFITEQVEPGTIVAFSMIYEPTEGREDRWRISAVKVTGVGGDSSPAAPPRQRASTNREED